ncbi:MAG: tetratricopeptide repeat protein [Terracidiphilus sp.]
MMNSKLRSLPTRLTFAAAILILAPVLPAYAQQAPTIIGTPVSPIPDHAASAAAAQPATPAAATEEPAGPALTPPDRADAYFHDAMAAIYADDAVTLGRPDDVTRAIEEYKYALNDDPTSAELSNGLADLYFRTGRAQDAKATAEGLLKTDPGNIAANKLLGRIYLRQLGEQDAGTTPAAAKEALNNAISVFEKLVQLEPKSVEDRMVLGQLYTVNKQNDKAEAEFKSAQAIEPDSEDVVLNLARIYSDSGNLQQAIKVIESVPEGSRTPKMEFALGGAYEQLKDTKDAITAYQQATNMDPDDLRAVDALAQALLTNNQLDEALKEFKTLAADDPEVPDPLIHIGEIQRKQGKYQDALAAIKKARTIDPSNLEAGFNEGMVQDILGQFDAAAQTYQSMVDLTSHANGAYTADEKNNRGIFLDKLAGVYEEENKTDLAVAAYQQMVNMGGDSAVRGYEGQVDAYHSAQEYDKAIALSQKAIEANPKNSDLKLMLAGELADQGQADRGIAMAEAQLAKAPSDLTVYEALAQIEIRLKRWKDAEDDLNKAEPLAAKKDDKVYLLFLHGELADRQKHFGPAEQYFRQALVLDPTNAMTLNYLGYMMADKGVQLPEALNLIQQAVKQEPWNAAYLDSLGWVYYKMGQYDLAEDNLRSAVSRDQVDPTVHMHMGDLYEKTGRIRLAAAQWQLSAAEFAKSIPADVEPGDAAKVEKKLESARVKLAKEDSQLGQQKPPE